MPISNENNLTILDLFEAHETALYDLYNLFASKYGDYEDFWHGIAEEEKVHARWISSIRSKVQSGEISVSTDRVSLSTIQKSLEYLQSQISLFSFQENTLDQAFVLAMQLENSFVERGIFDIIKTDSERVKKTLLNLIDHTRMHYFRIKEMAKKRTPLQGLVDLGALSVVDLASASDIAAKEGESIESVIMHTFKVSKKTILACVSTFYNLPQWSFDATNQSLPLELANILAGKYVALKSELFVPVIVENRKINVAIANPTDILKRDYIQKFFPGYNIEYCVGIADDIADAVDDFFGVNNVGLGKSTEEILYEMKTDTFAEPSDQQSDESEIHENDNIVVQLVNNIIWDAAKLNASDIHIEPSLEGDVLVRYRIDGIMSRAHMFPRKFRDAFTSRIKIIAGLDIAERRKPQSGKIRFKKLGTRDIELRVETYNTAAGAEDIVMRILSSSKPLPLEELHFSKYNLNEFIRLINQSYGILLCVGPTGSGKTTTLHSALKYLNREDTKILTAEDPVEITQDGLRQVQVNPRAGITFASSMRSFLRADPDVIMIGEMRDLETASTAVEASLTGHIVLSTLHTNSASETIIRLIEMGIDHYSFADSLLGILAQRLVRSLCPKCKQRIELDSTEIDILRQEYGVSNLFEEVLKRYGNVIYAANEAGCDHCRGKGYKGRIAIHELLSATDRIKEAIYHKATASQIRDIAIKDGMILLRQDGIEKVFSGKTTIEEIRAATNR